MAEPCFLFFIQIWRKSFVGFFMIFIQPFKLFNGKQLLFYCTKLEGTIGQRFKLQETAKFVYAIFLNKNIIFQADSEPAFFIYSGFI